MNSILRDCLPICTSPQLIVTEALLPDIVSSLFGGSWTAHDLRQIGMRIVRQERLLNMRKGITRKDDTLPSSLLNEPKPHGPTKGSVVPL